VHRCGQRFLEDGHEINVITVGSSASFVAIGQFTQVVHTWLRSLEGELWAAKGGDSCCPFDADVPRFVWSSPEVSSVICARQATRLRLILSDVLDLWLHTIHATLAAALSILERIPPSPLAHLRPSRRAEMLQLRRRLHVMPASA